MALALKKCAKGESLDSVNSKGDRVVLSHIIFPCDIQPLSSEKYLPVSTPDLTEYRAAVYEWTFHCLCVDQHGQSDGFLSDGLWSEYTSPVCRHVLLR